jgi:hypothetical protein
MPSTSFTVHTSLTPDEVLTLLTDFGPERVSRWPNIDQAHFAVHDRGEDWAEVTEGNSLGWERERYAWDAAAGTVTVETLESNLWGPGSGWEYRLVSAADGTDVHVTLNRNGRALRGRLVGALIPFAGARALGKQLGSVLRQAEQRGG